jgi:hypothetical protein
VSVLPLFVNIDSIELSLSLTAEERTDVTRSSPESPLMTRQKSGIPRTVLATRAGVCPASQVCKRPNTI